MAKRSKRAASAGSWLTWRSFVWSSTVLFTLCGILSVLRSGELTVHSGNGDALLRNTAEALAKSASPNNLRSPLEARVNGSMAKPRVVVPRKLMFISIPLNEGETIRKLISEGASSVTITQIGPNKQVKCRETSVPPEIAPQVFGGQETVCVVRDPYERLIAAFRQTYKGKPHSGASCLDGLNSFVRSNIFRILGNRTRGREADPYTGGCQFLPQASFVYGWRADINQVDDTRRWCDHPLNFLNLQPELNELLEEAGYEDRLENWPLVSAWQHVCPMLTRRSLKIQTRALVEQIYKDDFRLLGFKLLDWPEFIHIPRTGGTTVEDVSQTYELWGRRNPRLAGGAKWMGPKKLDVCYPQHVPPSVITKMFEGRETFCIVRDVYTRMISEFGYWAVARFPGWVPKYACNVSELNRFMGDKFGPDSNDGYRKLPHRDDCHLLPQSAYVYSWDRAKWRVDRSRRWCQRVIRFERLHEEMNSFWGGHGYPMRLHRSERAWTRTGGPCGELKPHDLTEASKRLLQEVYEDDFSMMLALDAEAAAAPRPKPPPTPAPQADEPDLHRVLVQEERDVEKSTLVADDVDTGVDFEISFDLTPMRVVEPVVSILRFTNTTGWWGGDGDRIPAALFNMNSTKLMVYMGRPGNANAFCQTSDLPVRKTSRVTLRLEESSFVVSVAGTEACVVRDYDRKYPARRNVKLWIGDTFNEPADATVANLVYKVLGG